MQEYHTYFRLNMITLILIYINMAIIMIIIIFDNLFDKLGFMILHQLTSNKSCAVIWVKMCNIFQGEILPSAYRSYGSGLLGICDNISLFISTKMVPTWQQLFGVHGAFLMYACVCSIGTSNSYIKILSLDCHL